MNSKSIAIIAFLLSLVSLPVYAAPVVGDSAIFVDDKDPNLFHYHPDRMILASDSTSKRKTYGCIQIDQVGYSTGSFTFDKSDQLIQALAKIKNSNPNAKFAALPLGATQFINPRIPISCLGNGVTIGAAVACTWQIAGAQACNAVKKAAAKPEGFHILDFSFTFFGIVQGQPRNVTRMIPVVLSGID